MGTGIDVTEVGRIRRAVERHGRRFLERIYTEAEIAYCERRANRWERFAARFAAKEAAFKALGTGWRRGVRWRDVEVVNEPGGKPMLRLSGTAERLAGELGVRTISVSLTHTNTQGVAQVIFES